MASPPTRGRGLKLEKRRNTGSGDVAPHAGAWIETPGMASLIWPASVAPHAGAWIETAHSRDRAQHIQVAPHAGAWIETS